MDLGNGKAALFVRDIEISKNFYAGILGLPVEMDFGKNMIFKNGFAIWEIQENHIISTTLGLDNVSDQGFNRFELYFEAENLQEIYETLKSKNVRFLHELHEEPWGQQTIRFFDPDNHLIEIGESLRQFVSRFYNEGLTPEQVSLRTSVPVEEVKRLINKKEILILKNIKREGPGLLEEIIKELGIKYSVVDIDQLQYPDSLENYGAVIILGGPDSANDKNKKMEGELALIKRVLKANIPYLGICLGLQTLVRAAGGQVVKNTVKEAGFRDHEGNLYTVELTEEGEKDPLFKDLENSFNVFHLHGETVVLTENMKLLATGKFCRNQIVKTGTNSYGFQCHFEFNRDIFETLINEDPDLRLMNTDQLRSDFDAIKDKYTQTGRQLFKNFLHLTGFL